MLTPDATGGCYLPSFADPCPPSPSLPDAVPDIMFNIARTCANLTESFIAVVMCHRRTDGMVVPHMYAHI